MSLSHDVRLARRVAAACGSAVLLLGASACGSGGNGDNPRATGQAGEQGGPQNQQGGGPGTRMPGAVGKVAAVADTTAQVQGMDGQVAVTWTGSTTFTKEVAATLADVAVGDCVLVGSADQTSSTDGPATAVTAADVRITPRTSGSCDVGMRGPGGPGGAGPQLNGTPPEGAPSGGQRPQMRAMAGAVGKVTAVAAGGFTVAAVRPGSDGTTSVAVSVTSRTTYSATVKGAASDVKIGVCVAANGTTDDTGAVTAKTVAVSQPKGGQCGGFVRFGSSDGASTQES